MYQSKGAEFFTPSERAELREVVRFSDAKSDSFYRDVEALVQGHKPHAEHRQNKLSREETITACKRLIGTVKKCAQYIETVPEEVWASPRFTSGHFNVAQLKVDLLRLSAGLDGYISDPTPPTRQGRRVDVAMRHTARNARLLFLKFYGSRKLRGRRVRIERFLGIIFKKIGYPQSTDNLKKLAEKTSYRKTRFKRLEK